MANPDDPRTKRRQAMGDDPNKVMMSPQPLPGAPQGRGNIMNNPVNGASFNPQVGTMDPEGPRYTYGEVWTPSEDQGNPLGAPTPYLNSSGMPQNLVPGRGNNRELYNAQSQPDQEQMSVMEPMYDMNQAKGLTEPNGLNNGQAPSYMINAMGMAGRQPQMGPMPGALPPNMPYNSPNALPLQGMQDAQMAAGGGMNTKSGKRNA